VVSYAVAAPAEHVVDGVSGRLVAPGDADAFVAAAASLAMAVASLEPMRAAALAAARRASWPEVLTRFERHLEATLHALETPPGRIALVA
jgi:glycosyltransferase involved in cell wall biosynthesis